MSATKSPIATRDAASGYGWASPWRTARGSRGRDSAAAPRTKVGVRTQTVSRSGAERASRIRPGAAVPGSCWTAVLNSTIPVSWARWARAQPTEIGPPQSWATVTTGPVDAQRGGQIPEVVDALGQPPGLRQPVRPAHAQLVDCDHPPTRWGVRDEPAPQERPGGVAVHAQHRSGDRIGPVVEHMPAVVDAGPVGNLEPARVLHHFWPINLNRCGKRAKRFRLTR